MFMYCTIAMIVLPAGCTVCNRPVHGHRVIRPMGHSTHALVWYV